MRVLLSVPLCQSNRYTPSLIQVLLQHRLLGSVEVLKGAAMDIGSGVGERRGGLV
jgi:hypothetical protein